MEEKELAIWNPDQLDRVYKRAMERERKGEISASRLARISQMIKWRMEKIAETKKRILKEKKNSV